MKTLQDLFIDTNTNTVTADLLSTVKVKNLPNSDTGDLWAIGVEFNGEEYGGTVIVTTEQVDHMTLVHAGVESFSAKIVNGDHVTIL